MVAEHIANGMYGMILVEPAGGPERRGPGVLRDAGGNLHEGRLRGEGAAADPTLRKLLDERPDYFVFNGAVGALTERKPMKAT